MRISDWSSDVCSSDLQLPLPKGMNAAAVLDRIVPTKDVDGFHPVNVGRLSSGTGGLVPCTPLGIILLLDSVVEDYRGLNVVVIGTGCPEAPSGEEIGRAHV